MDTIPTKRQAEILGYVSEHRARRGVSPTEREIQARFGFASKNAVRKHLEALGKKGLLKREEGFRTLVPADEALPSFVRVPLLGFIPAGHPVDVEQQTDRCISVDADMLKLPKNARTFAVRVKGDSMINAGIHDGDYVILEHRPAVDGDIVAAAIDGEMTLKRLVTKGGKPYLKAENPAFKNLIPAYELLIEGVFRALVRLKA